MHNECISYCLNRVWLECRFTIWCWIWLGEGWGEMLQGERGENGVAVYICTLSTFYENACVGVVYARLLGLWWFFFCIEWQRLMEWLCDSLRFVFNLIYWVVCAPRQLFCSIWSLSYLSRFLLLLFLMMVVCVFWCGSCSLARLGWVLSVLQAANCVHIGRPLHFWIFRCVSSASINRSVTNPLVVALPLVPFCVA